MLGFFTTRRAVVHARERQISIYEPGGIVDVEAETPITAVATAGDIAVYATRSENGTFLWRISRGDRAPRPLVELSHDVSWINLHASGAFGLFGGARTSRVTFGESSSVSTFDPVERGVALGDGRWIGLRRSAVEVHAEGDAPDVVHTIRRDGTFVYADSLGEPAAVLFVHNQHTHSLVQHINVRTRVASTGLLVPLSSLFRVARARRMALLWSSSTEQLHLLDLRIGRLLASRGLPSRPTDIDIDANAEEVAIEIDGKLTVMRLSQLMSGGAVGTGESQPGDEAATSNVGHVTEPTRAPAPLDASSLEPESAAFISELPIPPGLTIKDPIDPKLAEFFLDRALDLIAALSRRAIARAWDTGRLAFHEATTLPYEGEVDALLTRRAPRAAEKVALAQEDILTAGQAVHFLWDHAVLAPGGVLADRSIDDPLAHEIDWPLRGLVHDFRLSPVACDVLLALIAPSARPEFARVFAIIRNDPARPLCDEMLLCQLLESRAPPVAIAAELESGAPLLRYGLIRRGEGERIFAPLTVDAAVMARLRGMALAELDGGPRAVLEGFWISNDAVAAVERALEDSEPPLRLLIRGRRSAGRRTLAAMIAAGARRWCDHIDVRSVAKKDLLGWVHLRLVRASILGYLPCVSGLDEPDLDSEIQAALLREVRDHRGPIVMRAAPEWTPGAELSVTTIDLPRLSETGRRQVWQQRLERFENIEPSAIDAFATRHAVGPGRIIAVTERLSDNASSAQVIETIEARLADARESRLGAVATRMRNLTRWEDVVLPEDVWQRIQELMARVKYRRQVYETWGFQNVATTSLGITALFQGGPGTGKTLVAGAIARELDYELYRVDVSRIVSKWIGETEKNLATIFDSAEDGRLVLLFDEADTLFAKRTEVKTSVDRYANSEVNFLLQRLDSFQGVAILTTNRPGAMDPAFQRRLSMAVAFPEPDEDLRERIWEVHIPKAVPRAPDLDLGEIARHHQFSGGHIRNAVMRALFFAASEGTPLNQAHLGEAIRLEYQNLGKLSQGGAVES